MGKLIMRVTEGLVYVCAMSIILTVPVKAYIDPSATTYVIQAAAAAVIAIGACFTIFRHKIALLFKKNKKDETKEIVFKTEENPVEKTEE